MACGVCEHCNDALSYTDTFTIRKGYSYHEKCHKCYVCSETNLQDAEVFRGVIFCSRCSQRIFQGCATARKIKNTSQRNRVRSHKRRSHRTQYRKNRKKADGILGLTTLSVSTDTIDGSAPRVPDSKGSFRELKISAPSKDLKLTVQDIKEVNNEEPSSLKKKSVDMGTTTEVTQKLLKQMYSHILTERKESAHRNKPKTISERERNKKPLCSDLRIAELGTSTEIANMALRNNSDLTVTIKSDARVGQLESLSLAQLNQESDKSNARSTENWMDSAHSSLGDSTRRTHWMDRRLGSILKLPYRAFKKNILNRSPLVNKPCENDNCIFEKIKLLFYEEVTDHRRGLKRLYSTINRRSSPNKLGWPSPVVNVCTQRLLQQRRAHFRTSHSYRCMRAQVMRLAGPTASELGRFRKNLKNFRFRKSVNKTKRKAIEYNPNSGPVQIIQSKYEDEDS